MKKLKIATIILTLLLTFMPSPGKAADSPAASQPGVYVEELSAGIPSITPVETAVAGFLGQTEKGPVEPQLVSSYEEYEDIYGGNPANQYYLPDAVKGYFENGGTQLYVARVVAKRAKLTNAKSNILIKNLPIPLITDYLGNKDEDSGPVTGLNALGHIDEITILYSPDAQGIAGLSQAMIDQCETLRDRVVIMDSALSDTDPEPLDEYESSFAAYYSPWLKVTDAAGSIRLVPPGGFIAGTYAKNDIERGVHKSPALITLSGITGVERVIGKSEQGDLLWKKVNPIIQMTGKGILAYGARTLAVDSEYSYISIRRYLNFIDESISESMEYLAFETWTPALNGKIKGSIENFLTEEWRNGALLGNRQNQAYFVNVSLYPASQDEPNEHAVFIEAGVALVRPAEFHIVKALVTTG